LLATTRGRVHIAAMHTYLRLALSALLCLSITALTACGDDDDDNSPAVDGGSRDLGGDAARPDAGAADAGEPADASREPDAASSDASAADLGSVDLGTAPDCTAQDARGVGDCEAIVGIFFDGTDCVTESGCSCVGTKCGDGFDSTEACELAYDGCIVGASCAAILCGPGTECIDCPRGGLCVASGTGCP